MNLIRLSFEKYMTSNYDTRLLRNGEGYAGEAVNNFWNMWKFAHGVASDNNVSFRKLDLHIADMYTAEEWGDEGCHRPCDGFGNWCMGDSESDVSCFEQRPEWADSVAWYNK